MATEPSNYSSSWNILLSTCDKFGNLASPVTNTGHPTNNPVGDLETITECANGIKQALETITPEQKSSEGFLDGDTFNGFVKTFFHGKRESIPLRNGGSHEVLYTLGAIEIMAIYNKAEIPDGEQAKQDANTALNEALAVFEAVFPPSRQS